MCRLLPACSNTAWKCMGGMEVKESRYNLRAALTHG